MKETIVKINKMKSWFIKKINLTNLQPDSSRNHQINKIRNEKDYNGQCRNTKDYKIRDYYEQLYGNKMDNLEEMDRFLEKFNLAGRSRNYELPSYMHRN